METSKANQKDKNKKMDIYIYKANENKKERDAITIFNWSTHIEKDELHEEACSKRKCVQSKIQNYSYDQIT